MPCAIARDQTRLHYEECGKGTPLIFVHEFSGDSRSREAQLRFFFPALPLHRVQRTRLPAIGRASGKDKIFLAHRRR